MNLNILGFGKNAAAVAQVDALHAAMRVSMRPPTADGGGHYSIGMQTGTMAAGIASAAQIFQFRWADPNKIALIKKVTVQCATLTGFAAVSLGAPLELILSHGSTANGSGGTAATINGLNLKWRNSFPTSGLAAAGNIRCATTAALTAATGETLEAAALASCLGAPNATLAQSPVMTLHDMQVDEHPLILQAGDSAIIRTNTPAATGTWVAVITATWAEATEF